MQSHRFLPCSCERLLTLNMARDRAPRDSRCQIDLLGHQALRPAHRIHRRRQQLRLSRPWKLSSHSSLRNDNLQVLAWHDHSAVIRFVHTRYEREKVAFQTIPLNLVERCERLEHRTVVGLEDVNEM